MILYFEVPNQFKPQHIPFQHIPAKSPDVSRMDYYGFRLLKRTFSKCNPPRLWKRNGNQYHWKCYEKPFYHENYEGDLKSRNKAVRLSI